MRSFVDRILFEKGHFLAFVQTIYHRYLRIEYDKYFLEYIEEGLGIILIAYGGEHDIGDILLPAEHLNKIGTIVMDMCIEVFLKNGSVANHHVAAILTLTHKHFGHIRTAIHGAIRRRRQTVETPILVIGIVEYLIFVVLDSCVFFFR